jgi:hypothetical protein
MSYQKKDSKKSSPRCPVRCSTDVELDLDVKPKVSCHEISRCGTEFDVDIEFKVDHHCKLTPKKHNKHDDEEPCKTKCAFKVELDFECEAHVQHNQCRRPEAKFQLDVELDVKPQCKPLEGCKVRYHDKKREY